MTSSLVDEIDNLFNECHPAFSNHQAWIKCRELMYGSLTCMGRHTVTGMISSSGNQFKDWSSSYRLFSKERIDISKMMEVIRENVINETKQIPFIVAHMDDTVIKKTGKKIPGTAWRRDPLGPPFHTNFIWGQRFLQVSLALPSDGVCGQSRAIPVDFHHCPTAIKPKKNADENQQKRYKEDRAKLKLSRQGKERINLLRLGLNEQGYGDKPLVVSVDGSYTNNEVLKNLQSGITLVGRIRKDTKLHSLPNSKSTTGRKLVYGNKLPTPEEIRQSDKFECEQVKAWAAGKTHDFKIKVVRNVRWRSAGEQNLNLIIIKPLGYRLSKGSKILYRDPAYLICTETELSIENILQAYLWRWEIEVDFREEKSLLGCGQAQVRNEHSAVIIPAFIAAIYGLMHIATHRIKSMTNTLPRPKWYPNKNNNRITTGDLLNNLRAQLWAKATKNSFSGFVDQENYKRSLRNENSFNNNATFYIRN